MKILFASSSSGSRGGGELFLTLLGLELAGRGHEVVLWASDHRRMDELCAVFLKFGMVCRSRYRNMYDHPLRCFSVFFAGETIRRAAQEWAALGPDVIHLNKQNLEDGFDLIRAAAGCGKPCVATVHITQSARYLGARLAFLRDALCRRELRRFPGTFAVIQPNRQRELEAFLGGAGKVVAIENGVVDPGPRVGRGQRLALGIGEDEILFACVARMEEQKRPVLFVEWAARIRKRLPNARFVWVGDGRMTADWDRAVRPADASEFIARVGWQREVKPWLMAADVYLHTARYESFLPLSVLEAMAARLPVVMPPDLIADIPFLGEEEPFVVPLEEGSLPALGDPALLRAKGEAGRRVFERHFSVRRMADRYERLYAETLAGAPRGGGR